MRKVAFLVIASFYVLFVYAVSSVASRGLKITQIDDFSHRSGKLGEYKALVIGINEYQDPNVPDLETAVNDATAIAKVLKEKYGFKVEFLLDSKATRETIYKQLRKLAVSAKPDDSVLIYFAGHGDLDRAYNDGWWIPSDATGGNPATYLSNVQVHIAIRSMKARHVLLISDSCYSGTLFGKARGLPQVIDDKYYLGLYNEKSRWGLTSGNKEPVSDAGSEGHSVFAYQLLKELKQNDQPFISTQEIYTRIAPIISNNSEQTPLCRPIQNTGDQGGEFVFVAAITEESRSTVTKPKKVFLEMELAFWQSIQNSDDPALYKAYIQKFPKGTFAPIAQLKIAQLKKKEPSAAITPKDTKRKPSPEVIKARLFVTTELTNSRVKILNIKPRFHQGIELKPGKYLVEVSAPGHQTQKKWINLETGEDRTIDMRLPTIPDEFTNSLGENFVYIRPGSFLMGSSKKDPTRLPDEKEHQVTLTKPFFMQVTEVTVGQFTQFVKATGYRTESETGGGCWISVKGARWKKKKGSSWRKPGYGEINESFDNRLPVTCVTWNDAQAFIRWLNRKEGKTYRLPTEAQWEYASRAGTHTPFSSGNCLSTDQANYGELGRYFSACKGVFRVKRQKPINVGSLTPNPWKLFNMHGNVSEWCWDWYGFYPGKSVTNPQGPSSGKERVMRGGHWRADAQECRSAKRWRFPPNIASDAVGFRLVMIP